MEQKNPVLLITCFEPFGGDTENASMLAVNALPDTVGPWQLSKLVLPVEFGTAGDRAVALAEEIGAKAVICVGQAGGRGAVTPELVALNLQQAPIPDNAGRSPQYEPVVSGAPDAYFSTLPVIKMADAMRENGVPGVLSLSAGLYVCNDLYYRVLHHFHNTGVRAAFIHVPAASGTISMDTATAARALTLAIEQIPAKA